MTKINRAGNGEAGWLTRRQLLCHICALKRPAGAGGIPGSELNDNEDSSMTHVVVERCVNCRYTDCATVCPVECFWETTDPAMLVIDPDTCIDCGLCIPECPVHAIYTEDEVPEPYADWTVKNAQLYKQGVNITAKKDALPGALTLEQIQQKERDKGWDVPEPGGT